MYIVAQKAYYYSYIYPYLIFVLSRLQINLDKKGSQLS